MIDTETTGLSSPVLLSSNWRNNARFPPLHRPDCHCSRLSRPTHTQPPLAGDHCFRRPNYALRAPWHCPRHYRRPAPHFGPMLAKWAGLMATCCLPDTRKITFYKNLRAKKMIENPKKIGFHAVATCDGHTAPHRQPRPPCRGARRAFVLSLAGAGGACLAGAGCV